jgi:hypothetical protein
MSIIVPESLAQDATTHAMQNTPVILNSSDSLLGRRAIRSTNLAKPVSYDFTDDAGLIHQYCRLREEMFISVWGLKHFSGQKDRYDDISHIMVARRGLHVVAGGRLTIASAMHPVTLPMEGPDLSLQAMFPEFNLAKGTYGEFSRLAILPEFRAGDIFPEIARRFIRRAIAEGVDYAFNLAPLPLARNYRQTMNLFGLSWNIRSDIPVPPREEYEGIKMVISVMDLTQIGKSRQKSSDPLLSKKQESLFAE